MTKQWDLYEDEIKGLYAGNKLADVRQIMIKQHGFHASIRAYRGQLDKWGVRKYKCKGRDDRRGSSCGDSSSPACSLEESGSASGPALAPSAATSAHQSPVGQDQLLAPAGVEDLGYRYRYDTLDTPYTDGPNRDDRPALQTSMPYPSWAFSFAAYGGGGGDSSSMPVATAPYLDQQQQQQQQQQHHHHYYRPHHQLYHHHDAALVSTPTSTSEYAYGGGHATAMAAAAGEHPYGLAHPNAVVGSGGDGAQSPQQQQQHPHHHRHQFDGRLAYQGDEA
ncbi:hypothetical protein GGR56DRAFT_673804 [Xylariaceae sp. FL0804]|nr:hypothetical protein GGR56DRAFT_673804 [Xylariaceae sp. FL0804]